MTESEWQRSTDPHAMLKWLRQSGEASERKLRLFAVACCRSEWHLVTDENSRQAVEFAESYADGQGTAAELFSPQANTAPDVEEKVTIEKWVLHCDAWTAASRAANAIRLLASRTVHPGRSAIQDLLYRSDSVEKEKALSIIAASNSIISDERAAQRLLLLDIFGNVFRAVQTEPAWLTFLIINQAQSIYDNRAFDRLPELADALEQAGCANHDILDHCRQPGPHVRGCWVVDLVLGKQ
jgi:uncharacterized protein (DUF1800 family)